jgi:protocatechuate 3,4-dioxygenase beta subunit
MSDSHPDLFDLGLPADARMWARSPIDRRRILKLGVLTAAAYLTGCGSDTPTSGSTGVDGCLSEVPSETSGPYPADGSQSNGLDVLDRTGIVRSDIRTSLGTGNTAEGVPATVQLTLVNVNADCAPLVGYAVYLWHCNRSGQYSLYSSGVTDEDYLRGVQVTDSAGQVSFTTIFPACYSGRWPHIHFEAYSSLSAATTAANAIHTSQIALTKAACDTAYTADGYSQSVTNLSQVSLSSDNVFGNDDAVLQLATITGSVAAGYTIALTAGIAA